MTDAQRAKEWLEKNGWKVIGWFRGSWKVRKDMGLYLGDSTILKTDADLVAFAKSKGFEVEG